MLVIFCLFSFSGILIENPGFGKTKHLHDQNGLMVALSEMTDNTVVNHRKIFLVDGWKKERKAIKKGQGKED